MAVCLLVPLKYYRACPTNPTELVIKIIILSTQDTLMIYASAWYGGRFLLVPLSPLSPVFTVLSVLQAPVASS